MLERSAARPIDPFMKWAGGKRWLFRRYRHLFPEKIKRLIDPFVGGGSSFFQLQPDSAVLGDLNQELIEIYECVRDHPRELAIRLSVYHEQHCRELYYAVRAQRLAGKLERVAPFWLRQFVSDARAHKEAFEEVLIVSLVSLIPLFLLAVIDQLHAERKEIFIVFLAAISAGQLYLYSFSMLGVIFWLCWKDYEHLVRFPPRKYLALIAFLFSVLIIAVYSFDPTLSKQLSPALIKTSILVYAAYTALYYILLVYDNLRPPSIPGGINDEADRMAEKHRRGTSEV